jgi:AraC-like DNA-binding protein
VGISDGQHSFPIANALHLLEVVKPWNVRADDLFEGTGITREMLADPHARLPVPNLIVMLERARRLTGEPALGLHIGLRTRPTLYGHVGFALMSAANIREAIEISIRYGAIVTTSLRVRFRADSRMASLVVDEHADFGSVRDIVMISTLISLWYVSKSLTGRALTTSTLEFAFPAPSYAERLTIPSLPMRFGCPGHRLTFDARSLNLPYTMPDTIALKLAREQCQRELDSTGRNADLTTRVRALVLRPGGGFRGLEEIANALNRSVRTLKRQLGAHGVTFSELRDLELSERAKELLHSQELTLGEIASRLGYSNVTNFERAFQRWTGNTPAEYRRLPAAMSVDSRIPRHH